MDSTNDSTHSIHSQFCQIGSHLDHQNSLWKGIFHRPKNVVKKIQEQFIQFRKTLSGLDVKQVKTLHLVEMKNLLKKMEKKINNVSRFLWSKEEKALCMKEVRESQKEIEELDRERQRAMTSSQRSVYNVRMLRTALQKQVIPKDNSFPQQLARENDYYKRRNIKAELSKRLDFFIKYPSDCFRKLGDLGVHDIDTAIHNRMGKGLSYSVENPSAFRRTALKALKKTYMESISKNPSDKKLSVGRDLFLHLLAEECLYKRSSAFHSDFSLTEEEIILLKELSIDTKSLLQRGH